MCRKIEVLKLKSLHLCKELLCRTKIIGFLELDGLKNFTEIVFSQDLGNILE